MNCKLTLAARVCGWGSESPDVGPLPGAAQGVGVPEGFVDERTRTNWHFLTAFRGTKLETGTPVKRLFMNHTSDFSRLKKIIIIIIIFFKVGLSYVLGFF